MALEKIKQEDLLSRAKTLYFDKMPTLEKIYADEFGRFSYRQFDLIELNKYNGVNTFEITRKAAEGAKEAKELPVNKQKKGA